MNENLLKLLHALKKIERDNHERFTVDARISLRQGSAMIELTVSESADNHCFVSGIGPDLETAARGALANLESACEDFGYER